MARSVIRRGRMPPDDEDRIQKCTVCIEEEVEARDVTPHLFTAGILDLEDRQEIDHCRTRLDRVRRFVDILIMRGPRALHEFIIALDNNGYDRIATELKECSDRTERVKSAPVGERLKKVEDGWEILSRRLTRIESKVEENSDIPEKELEGVKLELDDLKHDLLRKVKLLSRENMKKDEMIQSLQEQLNRKVEDLKGAEKRIQVLETRIKVLEERIKKEHSEMRGKFNEQAQIIDDQNEKLETTGKLLKEQQQTMYKQHQKLHKQDGQIHELKARCQEQDGRQHGTEQTLKKMDERMNRMAALIEMDRQERLHMDFVVARKTKLGSRTSMGNMVARNRFQTRGKKY